MVASVPLVLNVVQVNAIIINACHHATPNMHKLSILMDAIVQVIWSVLQVYATILYVHHLAQV
jgi:hypothetical protein